jgi:hypothetical protein
MSRRYSRPSSGPAQPRNDGSNTRTVANSQETSRGSHGSNSSHVSNASNSSSYSWYGGPWPGSSPLPEAGTYTVGQRPRYSQELDIPPPGTTYGTSPQGLLYGPPFTGSSSTQANGVATGPSQPWGLDRQAPYNGPAGPSGYSLGGSPPSSFFGPPGLAGQQPPPTYSPVLRRNTGDHAAELGRMNINDPPPRETSPWNGVSSVAVSSQERQSRRR